MPGKLTWLLIWMAGLAFAVPSGYCADPGQQARLEHLACEAADASTGFVEMRGNTIICVRR